MHFVVNPAAAGGRLRREWDGTRRRLIALGFEPHFQWTEYPGHATQLAARLAEDGAEVVVAVGGDGTVDEVLQGLWPQRGTALGILPLGTGNDAARTLGIPLDVEGAGRLLLAGDRRRVDLIAAGARVVLNAIGVGILGEISDRAAAIKHVRGKTAYLAAGVATLLRYRCPEIELQHGSRRYRGPMTLLAIQNGPTTGGGIRLCPAARPDDGRLDVTVVTQTNLWSRLSAIGSCLRGTLGRRHFAFDLQEQAVELRCEERLPCHWDGNVDAIAPPGLRLEVLPRAIEVAAPPLR